jgi:rare lipoprotein A (peptidoglycan hydrolase)
MRRLHAQRQLALVGVAIVGATGSLAVTTRSRPHAAGLPPAVGSYTALAGSSGPRANGRTTGCDIVIGPATQGVANPVLPCGTRIYLGYRGRHILVTVIDHGPVQPGRQFDLTDALARRLGLAGVRKIEWSYAGES